MLCAANYVYQQCSAKDKQKESFFKKTNGNNWKLGLEEMTKEGRQIRKKKVFRAKRLRELNESEMIQRGIRKD